MLKGLGVTGPMESAVEILEIPLDSLVLDPNLNLRDRLDDFTVERYADSWQRLPPITVYDVDGRLLLSDGFHRHAAAVMLGKRTIRAEVVALDPQGRLKPGWPYRLPFDPSTAPIGLLTVVPDGRLFVRGGNLLLALDTDGRPAN